MSIELAKRLFEERRNLVEQSRLITDKIDAEKRDMTVEEGIAFDEIDAELISRDLHMAQVLESIKREADIDASYRSLMDKPKAAITAPTGDLRSLLANSKAVEFRANGPIGPVSYKRAMQSAEERALSKGSATAGGNTVETSFYPRLIDHLIEVSGLLMSSPTVLNTDSGEIMEVATTTAHSAAVIVAEAATIGASDPAFAKRVLTAYKYGILLQVSTELLTDTSVDLEGYLAMQLGRALGNGFGAHVITGTGTGQPTGVITSAPTGVTGTTGVAGAFTADNLIDLFFSVIAPYRNSMSCGWLLKDSSLATVRKLKDSNGSYLFTPAAIFGAPDMLLGKPINTDPFVPAVGLSAKSVVFGDFSRYFVRMVNGIRLERSDDFAFANDQVTWRALMRADGITIDQTGAIKVFVGGAS